MALDAIDALFNDKEEVLPVNVLNTGRPAAGFDEDVVVELPCRVNGAGFEPLRQPELPHEVRGLVAMLVLDEDAADDPVACASVDSYAEELSGYAAVAGKKVHFNGPFPLVLVGGLLGHATSRLPAALAFHVRNRDGRAEPVFPEVAPVAGALLDALEIALGQPGDQVRSRALASVLLRPGTP